MISIQMDWIHPLLVSKSHSPQQARIWLHHQSLYLYSFTRALEVSCPSHDLLNLLNLLTQTIPVADAKPDDIKDLLGGALFKALYKWMVESGPVYLLPTGPASSFLVISDPAAAKHVLRYTDNPSRNIYDKGLVAEVSKFLFGDGFAITCGDAWRARRKAVGPSLHRCVGHKEWMCVHCCAARHQTA